MAIKLTIELIRFLNAAKRLYNQNALTKSQILDFARREFGEVTGVLKTRLDKLFQKPATGIKKQETKKGEIVPMKNVTPKKEGITSLDEIIAKGVENKDPDLAKLLRQSDDLDAPTEKEMVEDALQKIADRKRLGTRSQESFIRSAVREFLERRLKDGSLTIPDKKDLDAITGVRQGGVDPIDVFRKAYGEDAIATVARMEEQFPDAFREGSFKEIGDEFEKLFKREAENFGSELPTPKEKYGFDEGLMTDQQLREMLEKDLREKQMLEDFDPTDRTKNADGGLAEILKV